MYARVRNGKWENVHIMDLENRPYTPEQKPADNCLAKVICVDTNSALYVLTINDDDYFLVPSIDLEFVDETPNRKVRTMDEQEIARLRQFTDWLHDEFLRAMREAIEAERIDRENDYSEFEETIDRIETRGAKNAVVRIWKEWQKLGADVPQIYYFDKDGSDV